MTQSKRLSFAAHGAVEFPLGLLLMAAPFVLRADVAGTVVAVALGAVISGLALSAAGGARASVLPLSAHEAYDQALALGGACGAVVLAIAGEAPVAVAVLVGSLALLALSLATRYTGR